MVATSVTRSMHTSLKMTRQVVETSVIVNNNSSFRTTLTRAITLDRQREIIKDSNPLFDCLADIASNL